MQHVISLLRSLRHEDGSALAFVAIGLPVLLVVFAIVVDFGKLTVHKRALQNEVDAAALAGSQLWGACFSTSPSNPASLPMQQEAQLYGGQTGFAHNYNPQVGGDLQGTLGIAFNSTTFPLDQPSNVGPDDTPADPCTLATLSDGKQHYIFDVKATDQHVPLLFGSALGIAGPSIHATARTELDQVDSLSGLLPIGVSDPSPKWMWAEFVDEDNGDAALGPGWIQLCKIGAPGCAGTPGSGSELWRTTSTSAVTFPSSTKHVGVRLKYVWAGPNPALACGSSALVECYDNKSPSETQSNGLVHIRVYPTGTTGVHLENVWMLQGSCTDGYFAAGTCDAGVRAEVDLGTNHPLQSAWTNGQCDGGCAQVWATLDGGNTKYQLSPPASFPASSVGLMTWTLASGLTLPSAGPHTVALSWQWKRTAGTGCTPSKPCTDNGAFNNGNYVQRAWVADNGVRSGPVQGLTVYSDTVTSGANSFPQGSTQNLGVLVQNPCFDTQFSDPNCPLVNLRVSASATGSESQSLDCDPNLANIKLEVATGCGPEYTTYPNVSGSSPCPTQTALWNTPNDVNHPWDCVAVQTGNGDVEGGLQARIGTDAATCANNWPNYPSNDKRQVPLFLVPFSAFSQSGSNTTYPVIGFAAFYVTGYKGDPCPNATTSGVQQGTIPGHFITYLAPGKGATPSKIPCDPLALTPCVPVLVK